MFMCVAECSVFLWHCAFFIPSVAVVVIYWRRITFDKQATLSPSQLGHRRAHRATTKTSWQKQMLTRWVLSAWKRDVLFSFVDQLRGQEYVPCLLLYCVQLSFFDFCPRPTFRHHPRVELSSVERFFTFASSPVQFVRKHRTYPLHINGQWIGSTIHTWPTFTCSAMMHWNIDGYGHYSVRKIRRLIRVSFVTIILTKKFNWTIL